MFHSILTVRLDVAQLYSTPGVRKVGPVGQNWPPKPFNLAHQMMSWVLHKNPHHSDSEVHMHHEYSSTAVTVCGKWAQCVLYK